MKQILEASKRALVLLLTGAMIATSVPQNAIIAYATGQTVGSVTIDDAVAEENNVSYSLVYGSPADGSASATVTATPALGYKIDDVSKLGVTGTGESNATFTCGEFTLQTDGTATATATIAGTDNSETITLANATASNATALITNEVLVAGLASGVVVEYSTDGTDYDSDNPTEGGLDVNSLYDNLYIKLSTPSGKSFTGNVVIDSVSEANSGTTFAAVDIDKSPDDTTNESEVVFTIQKADFKTDSSIIDLTTTITFDATAYDDKTYETGAITITSGTNATIVVKDPEDNTITSGNKAPLGTSDEGTITISVTPDQDYVNPLPAVEVEDGSSDPVTLTTAAEKTAFDGYDVETVYTFTALEGESYTISASNAAEKPKYKRASGASALKLYESDGTTEVDTSAKYFGIDGDHTFIIKRTDSTKEISGVTAAITGGAHEGETVTPTLTGDSEGEKRFTISVPKNALGGVYTITLTQANADDAIKINGSSSVSSSVMSGINETFTAQKQNESSEWKDYKDVTWRLLDSKGNPATLPAGLTADTSTGVYKLTGQPTASTKAGGEKYTLIATDTATSAKSAELEFTYTVTDLSAKLQVKGGNQSSYAALTGISSGVVVTCEDKDDKFEQTITIKNNDGDKALTIKDIALDEDAAKSFEIVSGSGPDTIGVLGEKEIKIAPKTTLAASSTAYTGKVLISSDMFIGTTGTYNVSNADTGVLELANLTYTKSGTIEINVNGEKAVTTLATATTSAGTVAKFNNYGEIDLGTIEVGKEMTNVVLTSAGDYTDVTFAIDAEKLPAGIETTTNNMATLTFSGTAEQAAYDESLTTAFNGSSVYAHYDATDATNPVTVYAIPVTVTYGGGGTKEYTGLLSVAPASAISYSVSNVETSTKDGDILYSWKSKNGDPANAEKRVIAVKNNSSTDLTLNAAITVTEGTLTYTGAGATTIPSKGHGENADFTIKAGETESFTITPGTANAIGALTITGKSSRGVDSKTLNLKYTYVNGLTVTNMEGAGTTSAPYDMGKFPLGAYMSFGIETDSTNNKTVAWNWGTGSSTVTGYTQERDDGGLAAIGLTFSGSGTLSGIPTAKGKYVINLTAEEGGNASAITDAYFVFEVVPATEALALYANNTVIDKTTGLQGFTNTTDGTDIETTITIKNNSTIDLATISVVLADDAIGTNSAATKSYFKVDTLSSSDVDAGKSITFKLTTTTNSGTATTGDKKFVIVRDSADAILFAFPVKVVVTKVPQITTTGTAYSAVNWSTTDGLPSLVLGTMGTEIKLANAIQLAGTSVAGSAFNNSDNKATWSWSKSENAKTDYDIATSGLTLTDGGKIYGTPVNAGLYYTTLDVVGDVDTTATHGTVDVVFVINGTGRVSLTEGATDLTTASGGLYTFPGAYVGGKAPVALNAVLKNTSTGNVDLTNLTVKVADDPTKATINGVEKAIYAGSAAKFAIDTESIAELVKGDSKTIRIQPKDMTQPGTYRAVVSVTGTQIADALFRVQFTVSEATGINNPETAEMTGSIGDNWTYQLVSTGAGKPVGTNTESYDPAKDKNGQAVKWYIVADTADDLSAKYTELKGSAGITSITTVSPITNFDALVGATDGKFGYEITDGKLTASPLGKVGTYNFVVRAYVPANTEATIAQQGLTGVVTPAQYKDISLTLTVSRTSKVYASTMTKVNGTPTLVKERSFDSSGAKTEEVSSYAFNELPVGAYNKASVTDTITLKNLADAAMTVKAEFKNKDESTTAYFEVVGTAEKNIAAGGVQTWTIRPATDDLAVGTYEADLVFTGANFATITIPVSVDVAEKNYDFAILNGKTPLEQNTMALGTFVKDKTPASTTLTMKNTGNMVYRIKNVVECADAAGTDFGSKPDYKFNTNFALTGATINATQIPVNDSNVTFKVTPSKTATAGNYTGYVRVDIESISTTTTVKSLVLTFTYTVLNNNITGVSVTPDTVSIDNAVEGYKKTDYADKLAFTLKNGTTVDDELNALANVNIKLEGANADKFEISGAVKKTNDSGEAIAWGADSMNRGTTLSFQIQPKEGMVDTTSGTGTIYSTNVIITADNYSGTIRVPVLFKVSASDSVSLYASDLGETVDPSLATRLAATLTAMASSSNSIYIDGGWDYYIDLNGTASATNYDFWFDDSSDILYKGPKCNLSAYENKLTYATGTAGITFKDMTFNLLETVYVYVDDPDIRMLDKDGKESTVAAVLGQDTFAYTVPYGKTLSEAIQTDSSDKFTGWPAIYYDGNARSLEGWMYSGSGNYGDFNENMRIVTDYSRVEPKWHTHTYPMENDLEHVTFDWTAWEADNTVINIPVTVTCIGEKCTNPEEGLLKLTATITKTGVGSTHTTEGGETYTASVTNLINGITYTDTKIPEPTPAVGHEWEYDYTSAAFNADYTEATISRTCKNSDKKHDTAKDGPITETLTTKDIVATPDEGTSCIKEGGVTYTATFKDENGEIVKNADGENFVLTFAAEKKFGPHVFKAADFDWTTWQTDHTVTTVPVIISCAVDETHKESVSAVVTKTVNSDGTISYTATATLVGYVDATGKEVTEAKDDKLTDADGNEITHEHVWGAPVWDIKVVSGAISGTATFTCTPADTTAKPHDQVEAIIVGTPVADGAFQNYTITAKDPAGKEYTYDKTITLDAVGNEVTSEAKTWTAAYATSGLGTDTPSVTITFTGDNGAVDKVTVTPEAKVNGDVTTYSISYKDRAGKTHKMSWDYKKPATEGGEPTITPGTEKTSGTDASKADGEISVSFAVDPDTDEEGNPQFIFAGAAIKPALVIRDEDRDVTLAQGVDYTLKWATNKAVGTAVVTVVGKGNYAGKSVTLSYMIAELKLGTEDFAVKKIKEFGTFTNGTDTGVSAPAYDGNAWTPEEITVTDANGADVVLKLQADGTYASEDSKTTAISIANNVNKGSATVSALNAKGKVVKKTFKIAAANLAAASESDLTFDPDEAVYAAKGAVPANLNVEYKGQELVLGQDYTVKYSYASKTKDAGEKAGMFTITGKGNFAGKAAQKNFDIAALELEDDAAAVSVFDKAEVKSIKPTISDGNGVVIPAKQLKVTVVKHGESDDTTLAPKDKVFAGDKLTITVEGVNDKNISEKAEFDVTVAANLGKAKVAVPSGFTKYYTGEAIELTDEDMEKIAVTINKTTTLKYGEDFEIAGYQNNLKKGNMTVILKGTSDKCSGTKTFKVKITAKTMKKAE